MKMNRALSLAMAGALGLSLLAGCGGGSGSATPAPADTSAPADHSGASGVIKIGGIGPLTGSAAVYGLATKQGAEVAVAEINALGGLQFSLDFQDDEGDAEKAQAALKTVTKRLDMAAAKHVIHKNQASNRKSGLAKLVNSINA